MIDPKLRQDILARITKIPIFNTLRMKVEAVDEGYFEITIPRQLKHDGIFESLHGGILTTLADSTAAFAILTLTGAQEPMTTTDLNIRFLAPCRSDARAKARVIKAGRTMCPVQVELFDEQGLLVAVAQVNYLRLSALQG